MYRELQVSEKAFTASLQKNMNVKEVQQAFQVMQVKLSCPHAPLYLFNYIFAYFMQIQNQMQMQKYGFTM